MKSGAENSSLRIVFILPTKNEQKTIGSAISALKELCQKQNWQGRILIADDSNDETPAIAQSLGAELVPGGNSGLGQAMVRGFSAALQSPCDWIVTLDADGQVDIQEIPAFFQAAKEQGADVVLSSRFLSMDCFDYPYPPLNWMGNRILVGILRLATFHRFTDSHGGIRLMKPEAVRGLFLLGRHTYVQETLIQMCRRGLKIVELPSRWQKRLHDKSRVLQSIGKYVARTLPALLYWLRAHHLAHAALVILAIDWLISHAQPSTRTLVLAAGLGIFSLYIYSLRCRALRVSDAAPLS